MCSSYRSLVDYRFSIDDVFRKVSEVPFMVSQNSLKRVVGILFMVSELTAGLVKVYLLKV